MKQFHFPVFLLLLDFIAFSTIAYFVFWVFGTVSILSAILTGGFLVIGELILWLIWRK